MCCSLLSLPVFGFVHLRDFHIGSTFRIALLGFGQSPFIRKGTQPTQQLSIHLRQHIFVHVYTTYSIINHYLFIIIVPIERTLLLALFAIHWGPILNLRITTSLALIAYECSYYITIFTSCWLAICFHILFALFANGTRTPFGCLLEFGATIRAFDHRKCPPTLLIRRKQIIMFG